MPQTAGQGNTGAYSTGSVFGADAEVIRQQIEDQARQQDVQLATSPNLNMGVVLGQQAGRGLGNFVAGATGYVDPRVREAKAMEEAAREVDSAGYSLMENPEAYYKAAYASLTKRGLYDAAGKVHDIMIQQAAAANEAQTKAKTAQAAEDTAHRPVVGKDGIVVDYKGQILREPSSSGSKAFITLAPPGTTRTGSGNEKSFYMTNPKHAETAQALLDAGWVDTSKLPNPDTKTPDTVVNFRDDKNFEQDISKPTITKTVNRADAASQVYKFASQANDQLVNGNAPVGFGAGALSFAGKALDFVGVDESTINALGLNSGDQDALRSAHSQITGFMAGSLGMGNSKTSTKELELFKEAGPQIWNTKSGQYLLNRIIMANSKQAMAQNDYLAELFKNKDYRDHPASITAALNKWQLDNPVTLDKDTLDAIKAAYKESINVAKLPSTRNVKADTPKGKSFNQNGQLVYFKGYTEEGKAVFSPNPVD